VNGKQFEVNKLSCVLSPEGGGIGYAAGGCRSGEEEVGEFISSLGISGILYHVWEDVGQ